MQNVKVLTNGLPFQTNHCGSSHLQPIIPQVATPANITDFKEGRNN